MKNNFFKLIIAVLVGALTIFASACTYRADGSVIQDVKFEVSYENAEGENVEINSTLKLYKTFAEKTTEHVIKLIKNGFYNDTNVVFDNSGSYLIFGAYALENGKYKDLITTATVDGEFKKNGFDNLGKLSTQTAGTLVMLRDPDSNKGTESKYNSAKASFAIILSSTSTLPADSFTAFGKIDDESLEKFKTMKDELFEDADGYTNARYVGDRDEITDKLVEENGEYKGYYEYFELDGAAYREVNGEKVQLQYDEEGDADYELWNKISKAHAFDNRVLPQRPITCKNFKLK